MRPEQAAGWWHNATTEQRLAQLDAGIELGMTARQIGLASGASMSHDMSPIAKFAWEHGRKFGRFGKTRQTALRHGSIRHDRSAYFRGERLDLHRVGSPDDFRLDDPEAA